MKIVIYMTSLKTRRPSLTVADSVGGGSVVETTMVNCDLLGKRRRLLASLGIFIHEGGQRTNYK